MTPQEFQQKWRVSRQDIAEICAVSLGSVNQWFAQSGDRQPSEWHQSRLSEVDWIFADWERIDRAVSDRPNPLKSIYEKRRTI